MRLRDRHLAAAAATAAVFLLYLATLAPTTAMWDAGEYIAAAKSLGVPHQPGNPLYVLIAHVAGLLPLSPSYAVRINVLAAAASAITAGLWFLCAERLLRGVVSAERARLMAAALAALLGATAFTVWNQSVVMEKVYPIALVGLALTSWITLLWLDADGARADRLLVLNAYLVGLTYAVHPAGLLTAPAIGVALLRRRPRTLLRPGFLTVLAGAFVLGVSPFAVLPIRAAHQPFINESAVSACEDGTIAASCTFSAETARRLIGTIRREQYGGNAVAERRAPFVAQVQMYWLYFKWQWLRDASGRMPGAQSLVAAIMLVLGVAGLAALRPRAGPDSTASAQFWYFGTLTASFTLALVYYLNFRYGWSQSPELGNLVPREPRDRDYFFMWTFSLWGLLAGIGAATLVRASRWRGAVLTLALLPLAANWSSASRRGRAFTRDFAADMLNSVEPNAVLITNGDNDSFPLWFAQEVDGVRRDVTVTLVPYLRMEWYARQLNARAHIWKLADAELDTIPMWMDLTQPMRFAHAGIDATITADYLTRDQILILRAIKDSFPERPIYFSFGPMPAQLGLERYVKRVGLVQKLEPHPVDQERDTVPVRDAYVDLERSLALWRAYRGPGQLEREGNWPDAASSGVPLYYAAVGQDIAIALDARGRRTEADEVMAVARKAAGVAQR